MVVDFQGFVDIFLREPDPSLRCGVWTMILRHFGGG